MTVALFLSTIDYERKDYAGRGRGIVESDTMIVWAESASMATGTHLDDIKKRYEGWTVEWKKCNARSALVSPTSDETSATN